MLPALLLPLAMLLLTGCSSLTGGKGISDATVHQATTGVACGAFKPITYSKTDTEETRRQIREHDAVGASICGWKR